MKSSSGRRPWLGAVAGARPDKGLTGVEVLVEFLVVWFALTLDAGFIRLG